MSSNINVNQQVRVSTRFVDFDFDAGTDVLFDPTSVTAALYKFDSDTCMYVFQSALSPIVRVSTGVYYYDWVTPSNGKFKLVFVGSVPGATPSEIVNDRIFYVGTSEPTALLGTNTTIGFLSQLAPIYLDPEIISTYFSDVDLVEAAEIIYQLSTELDGWFGTGYEITPTMQEYLLAATLCKLTKIYVYDGGMSGFTNPGTFMLGDLQVTQNANGSNSFNTKSGNRGNASTWCELAALLREELTFSRTNFRAADRGANYTNPIPSRALRKFE